MPEFSDSQYVDVDIEISASYFLNECSEEDIEELIDELEDRGYLGKINRVNSQFNSFDDNEWSKMINILSNPYARLRLSNEDIEIIKQIADKL